MPKIKEKGTNPKTIRSLDRSKIIGQRMKSSYQHIKEKNNQSEVNETSVDEYSTNRLESSLNDMGHRSFNAFEKKAVVKIPLKQRKILN